MMGVKSCIVRPIVLKRRNPIIPPDDQIANIVYNKNNYGYIKNFLQIEIPELKLIKQRFIIFRRPITKINTPLSFKAEKNESEAQEAKAKLDGKEIEKDGIKTKLIVKSYQTQFEQKQYMMNYYSLKSTEKKGNCNLLLKQMEKEKKEKEKQMDINI